MKKNLFFAAAIAVVAIFSSCTPAAEVEPTVTVKIDSASYKTGQGINGSITLTAGELSTVVLDSAGTVIKTYTTFTKAPITGSKESYIVKYDSLAAGKYTLKATLKTGQYGTKAFDVVKKTTPVVIPKLEVVSSSVTIYCTIDVATTKSTCASADGMTYAPLNLDASSQTKVDFLYFNPSAKSPTLYAPSAVPTVILDELNGWSTKNATIFAKTTTIAYATADYTSVYNALVNAKDNSAADLKANDVVLFKTASNKIGVIQVISVTSGAGSTDKIVIAIKAQK